MQSLSYVHCFIGFTFAFEIDHIQQGGEKKESGGTVTCLGGTSANLKKKKIGSLLKKFENHCYKPCRFVCSVSTIFQYMPLSPSSKSFTKISLISPSEVSV